jgi:hypothetical protein
VTSNVLPSTTFVTTPYASSREARVTEVRRMIAVDNSKNRNNIVSEPAGAVIF